MIFKRINRSSPEQVFAVFQANAASIAADDIVGLETTAASVDGVKVVQAATALGTNAIVGVVDAAIANGDYGLVQVYGYRSTSRILNSASSKAFGIALAPLSAADHFVTAASLSPAFQPNFVLLETIASTASTATVSRKIFIRNM